MNALCDEIEDKVKGRFLKDTYDPQMKCVKMAYDKEIEVDVTGCEDIPESHVFCKRLDVGDYCKPDRCIEKGIRSCGQCEFKDFDGLVAFGARLKCVRQKDVRRVAVFEIS